MVSVIDQFSILREYFGQILGAISLYRFVRDLYYRLTGRAPPAPAPGAISVDGFRDFDQKGAAAAPNGSSGPLVPGSAPPMSRTPLLLFLAAVVGIPYLLTKLFQWAKNNQPLGPDGRPLYPVAGGAPGEPPKAKEFATALFDFQAQNGMEIAFQRGDRIGVLSRTDPKGNPSTWWKGYVVPQPPQPLPPRVGMFPGNHVEPDTPSPAPSSVSSSSSPSSSASTGEQQRDPKPVDS